MYICGFNGALWFIRTPPSLFPELNVDDYGHLVIVSVCTHINHWIIYTSVIQVSRPLPF